MGIPFKTFHVNAGPSTSFIRKMNKTLLLTVICFLANTEGLPRTRRALSPGYLSIPGYKECLESQTWRVPNGIGRTTELCIPATKPAYCLEAAWTNLNSASSGLRFCNGGIDPVGILQIFARILSGKSADSQGSTKSRSIRPKPKNINNQPKPKDFSIRPKPQDFSIRPKSQDFNTRPKLRDFNIQPKPQDFSSRPKPKDFGLLPSASAAEVLESLFYKFSACSANVPAPGGLAPADCQFPFTYDGRTYNECTYYQTANNRAWCRTINGGLG